MNAVTKTEPQEQFLPADPMVNMIERVAMDPNSDLAKLERMLELKEKHDAQNAKAAFDAAFAKASASFPEIPLNGENKHQKTRYALLKDIIKLTRPVLAEHGLALSFSTETTEKEVIVTAELSHENGHTKRNSLPLPRDAGAGRNAVQAIGSTQTYGQRYTAQAILGLSLGEDVEDDGVTAANGTETVTAEQFVTLRDLIAETGTDEAKFHLAFGHKDPANADLQLFPAARFNEAKAMLERKKGGK
ncbi:ERF family protein [Sulfitobacter sp. PS-8MA]|uniref:ERF family protein n=1 Tax=Sulfitobacter sp. PS-8MA TaxID=3237707 RepID=UPI0034C69B0C